MRTLSRLATLATTVALTLAAATTLDAQAPREQPARDTAARTTLDAAADTTAARKPRRLLGRARALGAGVVDRVADARAGRGEGKLDRALSLAVGVGEEAVMLSPTMTLGRALLEAQRQQRASQAARPVPTESHDERASEDRDAALDSLMTRYSRILTRASAGDSVAVRQATRMQLEMGDVAARVAAMPGDQAPAAYERALRAALTCAETGRGCRAAAR